MSKRVVTFTNLIGPGQSPKDETVLTIRSVTNFSPDGEAINWSVGTDTVLIGGVGSVPLETSKADGTAVAWQFDFVFKNQRGEKIGGGTALKSVPVGDGPIGYLHLLDLVSPPPDPDLGPTYLTQALVAADRADDAADRAEAAAATANGWVVSVTDDPGIGLLTNQT